MSVEKFNPRIYGESVPYTQVNTKVIQEIKNIEAGFVWVYLLTLPPDWKVVKEHLRKHFKIGQDKIKKIFSYLNEHKLIEYTRDRLPTGQLGPVDIRVLNGSRFLNEPVQTTGVENHPVENHTCGEPTTTKEIDNKENKKKKEHIFSSSDDEQQTEFTFFDHFWSNYPRKQKKKDAERIWKRKKFEDIAVLILDDVKQRTQKDWKGKEKEFIPLPTTYLNGERWNDELIGSSSKVHPVTAAMNELKESLKSNEFKNFLN